MKIYKLAYFCKESLCDVKILNPKFVDKYKNMCKLIYRNKYIR